MFEDSLLESCGQLASGNRRWIAAGSVGLQCVIAVGIVAVPLLHPEALSFRTLAPAVVVPLLKKPPVVVVERRSASAASAPGVAVPQVVQVATHAAVLPSLRPVDPAAPLIADAGPMTRLGMSGVGDLLGGTGVGVGRRVTAAAAPLGPARVSAGVSAGMLLGEIRPVYPRIAIAARVEGAVVVEATISAVGRIESARVVSGPAMLAGAALDAVRGARYRPYLLNGQPTEVQTTVTVNFRMGGG